MSSMVSELYRALKSAGVDEDSAILASQAVYDAAGSLKINAVEKDLAVLKAELEIVKKMQWIILAGVIALVIKTFIQ